MKTKDMKRADWQRIKENEYVSRPFSHNDRNGIQSLLTMRQITSPLIIHNKIGGDLKIVDIGYSWLCIALEADNVFLTGMYDDHGELLQIYFDITAGNIPDGSDNIVFRDMYLDIVLLPTGDMSILDEDELDAALADGDITQKEYDLAWSACRRLFEYLQTHKFDVIDYCRVVFQKLRAI